MRKESSSSIAPFPAVVHKKASITISQKVKNFFSLKIGQVMENRVKKCCAHISFHFLFFNEKWVSFFAAQHSLPHSEYSAELRTTIQKVYQSQDALGATQSRNLHLEKKEKWLLHDSKLYTMQITHADSNALIIREINLHSDDNSGDCICSTLITEVWLRFFLAKVVAFSSVLLHDAAFLYWAKKFQFHITQRDETKLREGSTTEEFRFVWQ